MALWLAVGGWAVGQDMPMPGMEPTGMDNGAAPMTDFGGVSFFSQDLGTVLRLQYSTESYGQVDRGNFDVGTMQVVTFDDAMAFCDAQVTMNDIQGVGFNVGAGLRWMTYPPYSLDGRIDGVSIWADGTTSSEDNFFPQLGISYESLGEQWDFRMNGYTPLGPQDKLGDFVPTGDIGLQGNSIVQVTEAVVNSSFYSAEIEVARRMGPERDAWAFAGPYVLANDDDDSAGYRVGVRGYAYPDLLLQFAVSDDEIFHTNATFSIVWFVGRTRTDYQPACGVPDRFREPVMRHDYVILAQSTAVGGIPLTQPDGTALRVVHVDSTAGPGGDGTFENPFDMLSDINGAGSLEGDIILAHAESVFTGDTGAILKDDQRLLGEGDGLEHTVATAEEGLIPIPETALGARDAARPMILQAMGDAITLADFNEVANFDIDGQNITSRAIAANGLSGNANLHDLDVSNTTGFAVALANVQTGSSVTLDEFAYDGGAGTGGGVQLLNFDGSFNFTDSSLTNGTSAGLHVAGDTDGTVTVQNTVTFESIDGTAVQIDGDFVADDELGGTVTVNSDITNDTGRSVSVRGLAAGANIDFNGDITDTGEGIAVFSNAGGTTTFGTGTIDMDIDTAGATAILVQGNETAATTEFLGPIDIDNTGDANGFVATGAGTLEVSNTGNSITTATGRVVQIEATTIANDGVNFAEINRNTAGATTSAVQLVGNTGGPITLGVPGDTAGESGTIVGGTDDAIVIDNSTNVTVSGVVINNTSPFAGVLVNKTDDGTQTVNLNNLQVNGGSIGINVTGDGNAGDLDMTVNDTDIFSSTVAGFRINNVDDGTIDVVNATIDGNNAAAGADGVLITDSNATITFDADTMIQEFSDNDFEVFGGSGSITFGGDIINSTAAAVGDTTGRSVDIRARTGGSVNFTASSSINDDNQGMLVQNNTGGTFSFLGNNDFNTGTSTAVQILDNIGATINLSDLDIETTSGQGFVATGGGTLNVTGTSNVINRTAGGTSDSALHIEGMTIGAVDFESVSATDGNNGILLLDNTGGTITIGDTGNTAGQGGMINGTDDAGVRIRNTNAVLNGVTVTDAGDAAVDHGVEISHTNATAMNIALNRVTVTNATADRDGIVIDGTGGTGTFSANIQNLNVDVTGDGLDVNDGVTLTAGGTNTIASDTGVGLSLTDVTIAAAGANFQSVNVSAGTTNGVVMQNVTGGLVAITGVGTTTDSGGTLMTTGDAIVLENVANVDLSNVHVASAGGQGINIDHTGAATTTMDVTIDNLNLDASTGTGLSVLAANATNVFNLRLTDSDLEERVAMSVTGAGGFGLLLDSNDITTTGADVAFSLSFSGSAQDGDVTLRNGNNITADNATAFAFTASVTAADIEFAMDNNIFTNASAGSETVVFDVDGGATLDADIVNNMFSNSLAADEFAMTSDGSTTRINLNLVNNTSSGVYELTTMNQGVPGTDFNFGVVDRDNTAANNTGTVNFNPVITDFEDIPGPVEPPTVP